MNFTHVSHLSVQIMFGTHRQSCHTLNSFAVLNRVSPLYKCQRALSPPFPSSPLAYHYSRSLSRVAQIGVAGRSCGRMRRKTDVARCRQGDGEPLYYSCIM